MADWKDQVLPERPDLYVLSVPVPDINQATWLTMVVGLKREEQNPAVPVVLLCEALATKEQDIDHALRILEEHFAYHEVYRFRDPEALQQEVRNALNTDAVYTPYVLLNSTWKDYSPLSIVLRKVEIPPVGSLGY